MNLWFLFWVFLVVFITGIFLWSAEILFRQKRAWRQFAKKNTLEYVNVAVMKSPVVRGNFRGFPLMIYSEEQRTGDQRGRRFRTIIQMELPAGMPCEGIVASADNRPFALGLIDLVETVTPDYPGWNDAVLIKARQAAALLPYLTPERYKSLQTLMTIKSINAMMIFDPNVAFLRLETAEPFTDPAKLERMCGRLAEQAAILIIKSAPATPA